MYPADWSFEKEEEEIKKDQEDLTGLGDEKYMELVEIVSELKDEIARLKGENVEDIEDDIEDEVEEKKKVIVKVKKMKE